MQSRPSNPKDIFGVKKPGLSAVPSLPLFELGLAMMEGAIKYGRHNYRQVGVRSSVYYDAALRHLMSFWEGEDVDPDSGISHLSKAVACLVVLRDAQIRGMLEDDRPPKTERSAYEALQRQMDELLEKYEGVEPKAPITQKGLGDYETIASEVLRRRCRPGGSDPAVDRPGTLGPATPAA